MMNTYPQDSTSITPTVRFVPDTPRLTTMNKKVAVEPFPDMSVRTGAHGSGAVKVGRIENKVKMVPLKVVFPSEDGRFRPGARVLLRGDLYTQNWAKEVQEFQGQSFILVPETAIEALIEGVP